MENSREKIRNAIGSTTVLLFVLLLSLGGFLRFYDLNWGAPYYFHPDERNIASSISQLTFSTGLHPNFFAYGSLPIYLIFFAGLPYRLLTSCADLISCNVRFEDAMVIGRAISATLSWLLLPLVYLIGKRLHSKTAGLLALALAATNTGLLQFAHFATFETWSTFFSVLLFFLSLKLLDTGSKRALVLTGMTAGAVLSVKVSNAVLLPIPILALVSCVFQKKHYKGIVKNTLWVLSAMLVFLACVGIVFALTNPYVFLSQKAFLGSMQYESGVALGTIPVFYIGEFYNTVPLVFHFLKVFPFLLNPLNTLLALLSFIFVCVLAVRQKNIALGLLIIATLLLLLPQAFFFVKWTRYMVPTIPFLLILIAILLASLMQVKNKLFSRIGKAVTAFVILINIVFGISYVITAFVEEDTRVAASLFAREVLPPQAPIVADIYDMGIVPFNQHFSRIDLYHFYELDTPEVTTLSELPGVLTSHEYYILPSQRILATRLANPEKFPQGHTFYQQVVQEEGFTKIYESPCSVFCQITYLGDQIRRLEGTANAFERPPVLIYKINHEE